MHFTVDRLALVKLLEGLTAPRGRARNEPVRLWADGARLCIEFRGEVAGTEALVIRSGHCCTHRKRFLQLLKTYHPKKNLTFELVGCGLRFGSSTLEVTETATLDEPPPHFAVVPTHGMSAGQSRWSRPPFLETKAPKLPKGRLLGDLPVLALESFMGWCWLT